MPIGARIREIRSWRRLSLREAAELSGLSYGYLGKIERGDAVVSSRHVLESIATTLRVSPVELTAQPYAATPESVDDVRASVPATVDALTGWTVDETPDSPPVAWPEIYARTVMLRKARADGDLAASAELLPSTIRDLLVAAHADDTRHRALVELITAYRSATGLANDLSMTEMATLGAERMRQAAEQLDDPVWTTYAKYRRAHMIGKGNRARQYQLAVQVAEDESARVETRGMSHLTAALAAAVQGDRDAADTHLNEAGGLAETRDDDVFPWEGTNFGRTNVGIWRVAIGVEMGDGAKVAETAQSIRPASVTRSRQAALYMDLGRGLLTDTKKRSQGVAALLTAEQLSPQQVRANAFAREAVTDALRKARRDAEGKELRGLAWRMGVAPTG